MYKSIPVLTIGALILISAPAFSQAIFDFDELPEGKTTPFDLVSPGLTASFSSPDGSFWVHVAAGNGNLNDYYQPTQNSHQLDIAFSQPVDSISLDFWIAHKFPNSGVLYLNAYRNGVPVGTVSKNGFDYNTSSGTVSFHGITFDKVSLTSNGIAFSIDNVLVGSLVLSGRGTAQIDGVMAPGEWDNAAKFSFNANLLGYLTGPGTAIATMYVMNDATNLYLAVKIARSRLDNGSGSPNSGITFEFDNNHNGIWPENGDDAFLLNAAVGFYDDVRTNQSPPCTAGAPPGFCGVLDTQVGGTIDGHGTATNNDTYSFYEMSHPLNSGDVGHDFALQAGQTVGFFSEFRFCDTSGCVDTRIPNAGFGDVVISESGNTPGGTEVLVQPVDPTTGRTPVTLTFSTVTQAGDTDLTSSHSGSPPPAGFKLGAPPTYYELTTTAVFSGPVQICIDFSGISFGNASKLRLFHFESGKWTDVTVSLDMVNTKICGIVTSFSPFAIFESAYSATVRPPISVDGSSIFNASRGTLPVKFGLALDGVPTCSLPLAAISLLQTVGATPGPINEAVFISPADTGIFFRREDCQYVYNLGTKAMLPGAYLAKITIDGVVVGSASFILR